MASRPLATIAAHRPAFDALISMLERRIHHLAVIDERQPPQLDGQTAANVLGVITDTDLLRHHLHSPLYVLGRIEKIERPSHFTDFADQLASMVEVLLRGNLDAVEIGRIVSTVNDAATVRMIHLAQRELTETLGDPPCPFAWIVHGSEGRREQALLTDQDNAIVYLDATEEAERYFAELGRRVTEGLQKLGLPPCPGGFMADAWHKPLAEWQELFRSWIETPDPQALIDAANFFDHRAVWGDLDLAPLEEIVRSASRQRRFLAHMAKNALDFRPPIGLLRRIRQTDEGVDLKRGGIIPIVSLGRLVALEAGSPARGTIDRLEAGRQDGGLSPEGAETLAEAFRFLLRLRLEHQLRERKEGRAGGQPGPARCAVGPRAPPPQGRVHRDPRSPGGRRAPLGRGDARVDRGSVLGGLEEPDQGNHQQDVGDEHAHEEDDVVEPVRVEGLGEDGGERHDQADAAEQHALLLGRRHVEQTDQDAEPAGDPRQDRAFDERADHRHEKTCRQTPGSGDSCRLLRSGARSPRESAPHAPPAIGAALPAGAGRRVD